ncbi:MAG: lactate utilization protein [Oscillospiraceae bacterium]|nr:lactate utilization protein [Oscillospiraceae bacterium]
MDSMINKTIKALKENQFDAYYAENSLEAMEIVKSLIKEGERVDRGGSLTIEQIGALKYITENCGYIDPYKETDPAKKAELMQARLSCDTFLCSANAIITDGRLYNEDGACSRVAPLLFGPKQVIVVAGRNKLVNSETEARKRMMTIAAPLNAKRLKTGTPCTEDGVCHNCKHTNRICCSTVITNFNRIKGRIKVIIVNEDLGM